MKRPNRKSRRINHPTLPELDQTKRSSSTASHQSSRVDRISMPWMNSSTGIAPNRDWRSTVAWCSDIECTCGSLRCADLHTKQPTPGF